MVSPAPQADPVHPLLSRSFALLVQGPAPLSPQTSLHPCTVLLISVLLLAVSDLWSPQMDGFQASSSAFLLRGNSLNRKERVLKLNYPCPTVDFPCVQ